MRVSLGAMEGCGTEEASEFAELQSGHAFREPGGLDMFKRPDGTRRILVEFPGTEVPGYVQSFLRNELD